MGKILAKLVLFGLVTIAVLSVPDRLLNQVSSAAADRDSLGLSTNPIDSGLFDVSPGVAAVPLDSAEIGSAEIGSAGSKNEQGGQTIGALEARGSALLPLALIPGDLKIQFARPGKPTVVDANYSLPQKQTGAKNSINSAVSDPIVSDKGALGNARQKLISELAIRSGAFESQLSAKSSNVRVENHTFLAEDTQGNTLVFSPDVDLQRHAEGLMKKFHLPWAALVALDPKTGKVLALASHSRIQPNGPNVATRSSFPAASLFKVITAAAAVEISGLNSESEIYYRGGDYVLSKYNYLPDRVRDKRKMQLGSALGKSCNPAFARVALNHLSASILERYALAFGFNSRIPFDAFIDSSNFDIPVDQFELARTAAGFSNAQISPLHAAMIAGAVANDGVMMRPYILDQVRDKNGIRQFQSQPLTIGRAVLPSTAHEVMKMMQASVVSGTARKQFRKSSLAMLRGEEMAGKTGTLSGGSPEGRYFWFMGAAPTSAPEIAVAALVIDSGGASINGVGLARHFLEYYFREKEKKSSPKAG